MASTTSAAASMLLSGSSSTSSSNPNPFTNPNFSSTTTINGLNYSISDHHNSKSKPFYLLNNSSISSPSNAFQTITLDLTSTSSSSLSTLNRITNIPPRYSSTNLNFSSSNSNSFPISWSNGVLNYNKNLSFGRQLPQENIHQSYNLQKNILNNMQQQTLSPDIFAAAKKAMSSYPSILNNMQQQTLSPDIFAAAKKAMSSDPSFQSALAAAAKKAMSSDPSFQSALAAALSSIMGTTSGNLEALSDNNLPGNFFPILSSFPSSSNNENKCASSFSNNNNSSTNSQQRSFFSFQPSFPFASSKSESTSPSDNN